MFFVILVIDQLSTTSILNPREKDVDKSKRRCYLHLGPVWAEKDGDSCMYIPPDMKGIANFLYKEENRDFLPAGTGFTLIIVEGELVFSYIITCKHVVKPILDDHEKVYVRLERSDELKVEFRALPDDWIFHKDPSVDIAVHPHHPTGESFRVTAHFVDELLTDKRLEELHHTISEGDPIVFIGMFEPYTGYTRNIPVVRFGHVAMVTHEKIPTGPSLAHQYFLECQAFPFNSGAPVFTPLVVKCHLTYFILGIVSGFFPKEQHVYMRDQGLTVISNLGISTAVPAQDIYDVLYYDELVKLRQKKVWAGRMKRNQN
jgi:hypothetical protein